MKIQEIINAIKDVSGKTAFGKPIEEATTRDQILYGDPDQQCTGIVCSCYASVDVIREAIRLGCNFIIPHEALFWNHGDHTDWLEDNPTFQAKRKLLEDHHICVWRNHDHIHAGLPLDGKLRDGIFYGLTCELGWQDYVLDDDTKPRAFVLPPVKTRQLMADLMDKMNLKGIKTMGDLEGTSSRILIPSHIIGPADNQVTAQCNQMQIDTIISMEITDFTVAEFFRDAAQLGENRRILAVGHFNVEEPGMKYFAEHLKELITIPVDVHFVPSGDAYTLVNRNEI